jgi:hypothetical protein
VNYAAQYGIKLLFTFWATPRWANGGKAYRYAPKNFKDLQNFAYAAAQRYSGTWIAPTAVRCRRFALDGVERAEPAVPALAAVQEGSRQVVMQSAIDYAKICTAIYTGVHATLLKGEKVGCGVTAPQGNDNPAGKRPVPTPISFMRAVKKAGLKKFDAWAHNPYATTPRDTPSTKPHSRGAVTLGNLDVLTKDCGSSGDRSACGSPSTATRRIPRTRPSVSRIRSRRSTSSRRTRSRARTRSST